MNILITGAGGLIGSALGQRGRELGWTLKRLRRTTGGEQTGPSWDVKSGRIDLSTAGPVDVVVHLAGETVAQRWTTSARRRIRDSRVQGTRALGAALQELPSAPSAIVCASATGYYGDRGEEWLVEESGPGRGFLSEVCQEWEKAAREEMPRASRLVMLRFGIVLTPRGGALAKMLPVFRLGLAGKLGHGRQYWSWITLRDLVRLIEQAMTDPRWGGTINAVAPHPVTNAAFTRTLGRVLRRPTILGVPRVMIHCLLGDMGREALLFSARVRPRRLEEAGFKFEDPDLEEALRQCLL